MRQGRFPICIVWLFCSVHFGVFAFPFPFVNVQAVVCLVRPRKFHKWGKADSIKSMPTPKMTQYTLIQRMLI